MRKIVLALAASLAVLFALAWPANAGTPAAAASAVLTRTAPGGPPANPGDLLTASLTPGTPLNFSTAPGGSVGLFCKQSVWGGQLIANPPAPGTAAIKLLNPFTISSCYDNSPTVTGVVGVTVGNLPATLTVSDSTGFPLQILPSSTPLQITVTLTTTGPTVTCVFQSPGPVNGNTGPGGAPWVFNNQPFRLLSGSLPACGTSPVAYLTARYSPVTDTTAGGSTIFVN
ncbi:Tat pathway signal sequence domain protein [Streptomyces sp. NBC_01190]|uniref:Tat pathway signal sequence domain protein n=1 Tax=Streptomyces sp. NBC_01190 TaxID=2903767 RepID=UPI00386F0E0D|nr:Tat pathway signal sequence domain protein [Streptomyces sp. NBC_01190]